MIVVAASAAYVEALDQDLRVVVDQDHSNERVSVVSAGSRATEALLPVDGRLRGALGGTDTGLNARALSFLAATAADHAFRRTAMSAALTTLALTSPPTQRVAGKSVDDDYVVQQMNVIRRRRPTISRTAALREFREGGIACEQSRFASLWARVVA
jgi:hypothetical protein